MKKSFTLRQTCKSVLTVALLSLAVSPILASAGVSKEGAQGTLFLLDTSNRGVTTPQSLYSRLKTESRKICGESSIYLTGSLRRSAGVEECYQGTLMAAVERLGDPVVSALHEKETS